MAKSKSTGSKSGKGGSKKKSDMSDALRDAGKRASDLAQNPVARSMLAAGLVTAAAALTANKKVRDSVKEAGKDAQEAASLGATGTPTFLVNDTPFVGAQPLEAFEQAIDAELNEARKRREAEEEARKQAEKEAANKKK